MQHEGLLHGTFAARRCSGDAFGDTYLPIALLRLSKSKSIGASIPLLTTDLRIGTPSQYEIRTVSPRRRLGAMADGPSSSARPLPFEDVVSRRVKIRSPQNNLSTPAEVCRSHRSTTISSSARKGRGRREEGIIPMIASNEYRDSIPQRSHDAANRNVGSSRRWYSMCARATLGETLRGVPSQPIVRQGTSGTSLSASSAVPISKVGSKASRGTLKIAKSL